MRLKSPVENRVSERNLIKAAKTIYINENEL